MSKQIEKTKKADKSEANFDINDITQWPEIFFIHPGNRITAIEAPKRKKFGPDDLIPLLQCENLVSLHIDLASRPHRPDGNATDFMMIAGFGSEGKPNKIARRLAPYFNINGDVMITRKGRLLFPFVKDYRKRKARPRGLTIR